MGREERFKINYLRFHLKIEKEMQVKLKVSRRK